VRYRRPDALFLALACHGMRAGDEVITSPLTFIAMANARTSATELPTTGVRRYRLELAAGSPQV
jgi:hypothetical protein